MELTTAIIDEDSGGPGSLIDDNTQDFDVTIGNGERYTFALKAAIDEGLFAHCQTPEDIEQTVREILAGGELDIDCVIARRPMP